MLEPEKPILLVTELDGEVDEVLRLFLRTGFIKFAGYLIGGMKSWDAEGLPVACVNQMDVKALHDSGDQLQIVDVRSPREWRAGHVPGARHIALPELEKRSGRAG